MIVDVVAVDHRKTRGEVPGVDHAFESALNRGQGVGVALEPRAGPSLLEQASRVVLQPVSHAEFQESSIRRSNSAEDLREECRPPRSASRPSNHGARACADRRSANRRARLGAAAPHRSDSAAPLPCPVRKKLWISSSRRTIASSRSPGLRRASAAFARGAIGRDASLPGKYRSQKIAEHFRINPVWHHAPIIAEASAKTGRHHCTSVPAPPNAPPAATITRPAAPAMNASAMPRTFNRVDDRPEADAFHARIERPMRSQIARTVRQVAHEPAKLSQPVPDAKAQQAAEKRDADAPFERDAAHGGPRLAHEPWNSNLQCRQNTAALPGIRSRLYASCTITKIAPSAVSRPSA